MLLAHKNPSESYLNQKLDSTGEKKVLFLAFTSAIILCIANLPFQISIAPMLIDNSIVFIYLGVILFITVFFTPLFLYFLSTVLHLILKIFNGKGSFYDIRLAFLWSINVVAPILIFNGLLRGFLSYSPHLIYLNLMLNVYIAWVLSSIVSKAEKFQSKYPMFLAACMCIFIPRITSFLEVWS